VTEPTDVRSLGDRIEQLLDGLQATGDRRARERAEELVRLVTELYGAGLAHVMELVDAEAPDLARRLAADDLIGSLLLVHDLHPDALAVRVETALDSVRPFLATHGGDVELLAIDDRAGAVQLRLLGSCDGCPSSAATLQHAVQHAIMEAAPEIVRIDVDAPAPDTSIPIALGRKPAVAFDPATGCGAVRP
jgi:Fe-S cluster biogenesis protein NfuA